MTRIVLGDMERILGTAEADVGDADARIVAYRPEDAPILANLLRHLRRPDEPVEAELRRLPSALRSYAWARDITPRRGPNDR